MPDEEVSPVDVVDQFRAAISEKIGEDDANSLLVLAKAFEAFVSAEAGVQLLVARE